MHTYEYSKSLLLQCGVYKRFQSLLLTCNIHYLYIQYCASSIPSTRTLTLPTERIDKSSGIENLFGSTVQARTNNLRRSCLSYKLLVLEYKYVLEHCFRRVPVYRVRCCGLLGEYNLCSPSRRGCGVLALSDATMTVYVRAMNRFYVVIIA